MRLQGALSGLAALVLGLSLSPAFGATLTVDNFNDMGTVPSSGNTWSYGAASGVLGGARDLSKNNGGAFPWGKQTTPVAALKLVSTGTGNAVNMRYDSQVGGGTSQLFPSGSRPDFSSFTWLNAVTPSVATVTGTTQAIATIEWYSTVSGGTKHTSTLTLNNGPLSGGYSFKLSNFAVPVTGAKFLGSLTLRLQGLGAGTTTVDNIAFSTAALPEPGTLALAGLGLVGLVMARRKKRA